MAQSGVVISQEALNAKADVSSRKLKYAILKLSDDYREIVVETTSKDPHYESFYQAVLNSKSAAGKPDTRYGIYNIDVTKPDKKVIDKLILVTWVPEGSSQKARLVNAASKEALKSALGLSLEYFATDSGELGVTSFLEFACGIKWSQLDEEEKQHLKKQV